MTEQYDPQTDPELFYPVQYAGPGWWWQATPRVEGDLPLPSRDGMVLVLAPSKRTDAALSIDRPLWQVSWSCQSSGMRGSVGHGRTFQEAVANMPQPCPFQTALDRCGAETQAWYHRHPSSEQVQP